MEIMTIGLIVFSLYVLIFAVVGLFLNVRNKVKVITVIGIIFTVIMAALLAISLFIGNGNGRGSADKHINNSNITTEKEEVPEKEEVDY